MTVEIRVPVLGESLNVATVVRWLKKPADYVRSGETLLELETDKVSLEVPAPVSGELGEVVPEGTEVVVDQVLAVLDETVPPPKEPAQKAEEKKTVQVEKEVASPPEMAPFLSEPALAACAAGEDGIRREKMSRLRQTIACNLKDAQNTAAILTTFNEIDMSAVRELRTTYREAFEKKHNGVRLGFMSFFARAVVEALKDFPVLNAQIEGDEILYRDHVNLGIAVGTERGLVVPVLHRADEMSFAELERRVADYGKRARAGRVQLSELAGGSFTITNGGIFGSLLSTPILNVRQSGVLGIHAIQERPVARNGQVVICPMMYVALSYDHRLVDGREAVSFLVRVKELIEDPRRLLLGL